ncbi:glutamate--tRNA ligase [Patescibacteria group bacterium]|nr:glutamate--tRNA ligase [Patescibacteria group bacterium]
MVKVRFAPSPTGYLHIGGFRTYLYNWLYAKKNKGKLILRIEDTDRERYIPGADKKLIKILKKMGLKWDKGPYYQSTRVETYRKIAYQLIDKNKAYYCFCSKNDLDEMRAKQIAVKQAPKYDRRCKHLTQAEIDIKLKRGDQYVIRLKVPEQGSIEFKDKIRGKVKFDLKHVDDPILLKSDKWPTYHLANVIDDHLMGITHVIRGEEWLSSTPKHILVYKALAWNIPIFAHMPLILNTDRSKLSKREASVSVEDYLKKGYLKNSLINFLVLLGWNPNNDKEILSLKQIINNFFLKDIQKAGAIFDLKKLNWMNGHYIRKMKLKKLTTKCIPYLIEDELIVKYKQKYRIKATGKLINFKRIKKIVKLEQDRIKHLNEIGDLSKFFFVDNLKYDLEMLLWKKMDINDVAINLKQIKQDLSSIPKILFTAKKIRKVLKKRTANCSSLGEFFWPLRVALTKQKQSPPPEQIAEIFGKEKVLNILNQILIKIKNNEK